MIALVADLHLGAGGRLEPQRDAWLEAVDIANDEAVALVIAGDVFHRARPTPDELTVFADGLDRLRIPTIAIAGNHDVSGISSATALEVLVRGRRNMRAAREPQTFESPNETIAVLPWSPLRPSADTLLDVARALYARCNPDLPSALVCHWSIGGALLPSGARVDDVMRETMLPLRELETLGFDAVFAGHIHRRQYLTLPELGAPPILYLGSLMAVDHSEADTDHAVTLWDPSSGDVSQIDLEHGPRFVTLDIQGDLEPALLEPMLAAQHDLAGAIVRVRYSGTPQELAGVSPDLVRGAFADTPAEISLEPTVVRAANERGAELEESTTPLEAMQAWLADQAGISPELAARMLEETARYQDEARS